MTTLLLFAAWVAVGTYLGAEERRMNRERSAFAELSEVAKSLRAAGRDERGVRPLVDWGELLAYIRVTRPEWVKGATEDNPLPGLLPPGRYAVRTWPASQPTDVIVSSLVVRQRASGDVWQFRLHADGRLERTPGLAPEDLPTTRAVLRDH